SLLFFFFGSLAYVLFLEKQASVRSAIQAITHQREYLQTIFPYRGEAWGTWSQVTYLNQRHFASAIGILLLVLVFLVIRYRAVPKRPKAPPSIDSVAAQPNPSPEIAADTGPEDATRPENVSGPISGMTSASVAPEPKQQVVVPAERFRDTLPGFIFSGVLLGLLPMWNSAVFIAAAAVLGF